MHTILQLRFAANRGLRPIWATAHGHKYPEGRFLTRRRLVAHGLRSVFRLRNGKQRRRRSGVTSPWPPSPAIFPREKRVTLWFASLSPTPVGVASLRAVPSSWTAIFNLPSPSIPITKIFRRMRRRSIGTYPPYPHGMWFAFA